MGRGKEHVRGEVAPVGEYAWAYRQGNNDGFNRTGLRGKEIVELLEIGFRLGSWTEAIGVI